MTHRPRATWEGRDHVHPDYWTEDDHHRFEARLTTELHGLRGEVKGLARAVAVFMGGLTILAFLGPIVVVVLLRFIAPPVGP